MRKKRGCDNIIYYIPYKNPNFKSRVNDEGNVVITIPNKGIMNKISQVLYFTPKESQLKLDKLGSFVWQRIDNRKNIDEIAKSIQSDYKGDFEPLYERLTIFLKLLQRRGLILIRKPNQNSKLYFKDI